MALLQGSSAPDPSQSLGGGDTTVVGGEALLPDSGPLGTKADIADAPPVSDAISVYVTRPGDTLGAIAKMYQVSVNTIRWANDIRAGQALQEGQTLVILPISGIRYTVKAGDTLEKIAKRYKGNAHEIASFNGIPLGVALAVGDEIIVPDAEPEVVAQVPSSSRSSRRNPFRGGSGPDYEGYYLRPILGGRVSQGLHGYNGVDLATYEGAPVLAAASGDVIVSRSGGWNGGYGHYIVIRHDNGTQTLYAHLSANSVEEGWHVVQGQVIGAVGTTGHSTGPHVHFEVRGAKNPFDR